jgi:hypothetical protein
MWCGGGHLHKGCPEKGNQSSTKACCNCQLAEGEKPHPANYRGCKRAKEELRKKKSEVTPKTSSGRVYSSNPVKPHLSFAAALRGQVASHPQHEVATSFKTSAPIATEKTTGQSDQATPVNSDTDIMFRAYAAAGQIMKELKDAASEEAQFLAIEKFVFNLMKRNGK